MNVANISLTSYFFGALAGILAFFLFWRAGRRDLVDADLLFDIIFVSLFGAFIFGRLTAFVVHADFFQWSLTRLIFFNVYHGFDKWGVQLGGMIALAIFLRSKKINFWAIFDLAAAPLALLASIVFLGQFLSGRGNLALYTACGYFVIFWILRRLGLQKRHGGFLACFYLVSIAALDILFFFSKPGLAVSANIWAYRLVAPSVFLMMGTIFWYILAKKNPRSDLKSVMAISMLSILKLRRILTSLSEADTLARSIILLPYTLAIYVFSFVKLVMREIILGFSDFIGAFRIKR